MSECDFFFYSFIYLRKYAIHVRDITRFFNYITHLYPKKLGVKLMISPVFTLQQWGVELVTSLIYRGPRYQ